jgi:ribonuclease P/MRP protein subunit RPP1
MSLFEARFYDFIMHSPEKEDSISHLAFEAKRYGYSGIAITDKKINNPDMIQKPEDFFIYSGIDISTKPSKIRDEIKKYKDSNNILIVRGQDEELTLAAAETDGLDILLQPAKFNHIIAKIASDNSITLGFNTGSLIKMRKDARVKELRVMKTNLKYARKYGVKMILTCDVYSLYDLRSPREIAALSGLFGMAPKEAVDAMSNTPEWILRRKSPDFIRRGVEII